MPRDKKNVKRSKVIHNIGIRRNDERVAKNDVLGVGLAGLVYQASEPLAVNDYTKTLSAGKPYNV
jgi:hypothetical protein